MANYLENGVDIIYSVYRLDDYIGELKRLQPGIDMIKMTCQSTGNSIKDYWIIHRPTGTIAWSGDQ